MRRPIQIEPYLPAGADVDAAIGKGDERELMSVWASYRNRRIVADSMARARDVTLDDGETVPAEEIRARLQDELDSLAEVTALQALAANARLADMLTGRRWGAMRDAREAGASWSAVGDALGMSKQGALDWYTRKIAKQEKYVGKFHDAERARAVLGGD